MNAEWIYFNPDIINDIIKSVAGSKKHLDPVSIRKINNVIKKPYKTCTWYPDQCDAVGCDCGQGPCRDYKED